MESWRPWLLGWRVLGSLWLLDVLSLLSTLIHEVALLSGHRIVVGVDAWLSSHDGSDDWLHAGLDLLLVHVLWSDGRSGELLLLHISHSQIKTTELLSGCLHVDELLLETLLLICEVQVGGHQLGVQVGVHLLLTVLINMDLWGSEDLLWNRVHLARLVGLVVPKLLAGVNTGLWTSVVLLVVVGVNATAETDVVLELGGRSGGGKSPSGVGLWRGSQTCKQMRAGGAGRGSTILLWLVGLGGLKGETLDVQTVGASGSKARGGHAQTVAGWEVVVRHLSKTACVHTQ